MPVRPIVPADRGAIKVILQGSEAFNDYDVAIALEVFDIHFEDPEEDYELYCSFDENGAILGYICIGPTPLTEATWDIYWMVVKADAQGKGIGGELLEYLERRIGSKQGKLIVAETSSTQAYDRARKLYLRNGYRALTRIEDFYRSGDHLIIFGKYL